MRVTTTLWVSAYVRRCYAEGAAAVVMRRGAAEAGAVFVVVDRLDGTSDFYAPAPQSAFSESGPGERLFQCVVERVDADAIRTRIDRELNFDPDAWIVAVEDRDGRARLDLG